MVGTFYRSANPESPVFVEEGARVTAETVVCLVEAMKVFNEIRAECEGTIVAILVENGQTVEYGQPMFLVKPD
jgi:acetyl-CoA carboxylase biotin carboxyl carrier protein